MKSVPRGRPKPFEIMATLSPACKRVLAADKPAGPLPPTITSYIFIVRGSGNYPDWENPSHLRNEIRHSRMLLAGIHFIYEPLKAILALLSIPSNGSSYRNLWIAR